MSTDSGVRLRLGANLAVLTRANVIGHMARDMAAAVGVPQSKQATILEGFRDQLLLEVRIVLYDSSDSRVGYLSIDVDWEKHRLILSRGTARDSFTLGASESVASQVAPLLDRITSYVSEVAQRIGVARTMVGFIGNPAKRTEYNRQFGGSFSAKELDDFRDAREGRDLKATDDDWPEMTVVFRHINP